jgi:murein DD-endopeptidase MepM/ murein hydrolase activator NlpD
MKNPVRLLLLVLVIGLSLGAMTAWEPKQTMDPEAAPVLNALYAAPVEKVETHVLASGETLSGLLARAAITGGEQLNLLLALSEYRSPRRIAAGSEITVRRWIYNDEPRAIELRLNADSTLRLARDEVGWGGQVLLTPTEVDTVYAVGRIEAGRTLYEALVYDETSRLPAAERIQLVLALADVYQYQVDFTREIQPGDTYRLVYEREARPDGTARSRRILAAQLVNSGREFKAFWFDDGDEHVGYYDESGKSLRNGFLRYPVPFRITSSFSLRRYHPILGVYRAHVGTDFGAPHGSPVRVTADGTVVFAGVNGGYGNVIDVRHASGYMTRYAHLSRFAQGVRVGTRVKQEQVIGYVGATGLATGPHLHYELRQHGRPINAATADLPKGPPIPDTLRPNFEQLMTERVALLDRAVEARRFARGGPAPIRRDGSDGSDGL